jgi:Uma2 family endonuclease
MATTSPVYEASVFALSQIPENGKAEIVHGEVVRMSPTGGIPGRAGGRIYRSLGDYEEANSTGFAFPDNVGFMVNLPHRKSFSPDAAFHAGPLPEGGEFVDGAPIFAVEVRSENDYGPKMEAEIAAKRADYFTAGTKVVWDVDILRAREIRCYLTTAPNSPVIFREDEEANAEPYLPGWRLRVRDLLPQRVL